MKQKEIIIDAATIYPGKGGAGGGIWSYAANLLLELDAALENRARDISFLCMVNSEFKLPLKNIRTKRLETDLRKFPARLVYVHLYLPVYALFRRAVLHKLYFEVPYFSMGKMMVTIHDCMSTFYEKRKYNGETISKKLQHRYFDIINKRAIKNSKLICTPSGSVRQEIVEHYNITGDKIKVTPLATSLKTNRSGGGSATSREINIFCIAAFHSHKGHIRLIDVFEEMLTRYGVPSRLLFRGHIHDQDYYHKILDRIERSPVKDRISFIRYDSAAGISEIYQHADWLVLLSEYEGFGLPIIEAQANGVPVICSDIPVFREVGGDSVLYLNGEWDIETQAKRMCDYITDKSLREEIVVAGFKNLERYSWAKFAQQMLTIYEEI